jgi:hypothetical protein
MKTPSPSIIRELEQLDLPESVKVDFLLVLAGEKPANEWDEIESIYLPGAPADHRGRKLFDQVAVWAKHSGLAYATDEARVNRARELFSGEEGRRLQEDLAKAGKPVDLKAEIAASAEIDRLTLYVAGDEHWLKRMQQADRERDPQLLGECFGFPPSAIKAYVDRRALSPDRVRADTATLAFAQFMLSRDHSLEDLETAARWADAVKKLSPAIYEARVESQAARERLAARQLRVMLLATGLLLVPQVGQFVAVRDYNTVGHMGAAALLFAMAGVFIVPTSLILTVAIIWAVYHWWRSHERLIVLGVLNLIIILNLVWFFIAPCTWSQVFGLALKICR